MTPAVRCHAYTSLFFMAGGALTLIVGAIAFRQLGAFAHLERMKGVVMMAVGGGATGLGAILLLLFFLKHRNVSAKERPIAPDQQLQATAQSDTLMISIDRKTLYFNGRAIHIYHPDWDTRGVMALRLESNECFVWHTRTSAGDQSPSVDQLRVTFYREGQARTHLIHEHRSACIKALRNCIVYDPKDGKDHDDMPDGY
jgi:hypothetical protein